MKKLTKKERELILRAAEMLINEEASYDYSCSVLHYDLCASDDLIKKYREFNDQQNRIIGTTAKTTWIRRAKNGESCVF